MGREVRKVLASWVHPEGSPLYEGYAAAKKEFEDIQKEKGLQEALDYCGQAPDKDNYMPDWTEEEATHYQMYETTSEGLPISPVCESPVALAIWLVDNGASSFAGNTATYEQWLRVCLGGYAPSMVLTDGKIESGVAAIGE